MNLGWPPFSGPLKFVLKFSECNLTWMSRPNILNRVMCTFVITLHPSFIGCLSTINSLIFSFGTAWPTLESSWMVPCQNFIQGHNASANIAAVRKKKQWWLFKIIFSSETAIQSKPNYTQMVLRWSSFRIILDDFACQSRWKLQPN